VCGSVEGGRDQPLGGGGGTSRLSRKATVEKGRVPAYVNQTQREMRVDSAKLTSTARNTMRQIPRLPIIAPPSSWVPSQILGEIPEAPRRVTVSLGSFRSTPPLCQFPPELLSLSGACHPPTCSGIRTRHSCCPAQCLPMLSMMYMQKQSSI